jgi:hypothetical protein
MAAKVLTLAPPSLAARFAAAAGGEPLSALSPDQRAELDGVLAAVGAFEDLPGKWQAALLAAESGAAPAGGCCG